MLNLFFLSRDNHCPKKFSFPFNDLSFWYFVFRRFVTKPLVRTLEICQNWVQIRKCVTTTLHQDSSRDFRTISSKIISIVISTVNSPGIPLRILSQISSERTFVRYQIFETCSDSVPGIPSTILPGVHTGILLKILLRIIPGISAGISLQEFRWTS